jgi:hypothetical protein
VLLAAADTMLYKAKRTGRNRVEAAAELSPSADNYRQEAAGHSAHVHIGPALG